MLPIWDSCLSPQAKFDRSLDRSCALFGMLLDIFAPKSQNNPSISPKFPVDLPVACSVLVDFGDPIVWIRSFLQLVLKQMPVLAVPEFRIAKDCDFGFFKTDVGRSRNVTAVFAIPHPEIPQCPHQDFFNACSRTPDFGHVFADRIFGAMRR